MIVPYERRADRRNCPHILARNTDIAVRLSIGAVILDNFVSKNTTKIHEQWAVSNEFRCKCQIIYSY